MIMIIKRIQNGGYYKIIEGITVEDALPKIELSRKRKDKRVFGVLGDKRRTNNRAERLVQEKEKINVCLVF